MSLHEQLAHALRVHAIDLCVNGKDFATYMALANAHINALNTPDEEDS